MLGVEDTDTLVKQLSWAPEHRAARETARKAMADVGDNSLEIYNDLNTVLSDLEVVQKATRGTAKREETLGQLFGKPAGVSKGDWVPDHTAAINSARETLARMDGILTTLSESKIAYSPVGKKAKGHIASLDEYLAGQYTDAETALAGWLEGALKKGSPRKSCSRHLL